ncbi:5-(carboxyamino)imidazole ribonucleotide synthase [Pendulispora albinea]|uniref:N5-carboxyaminoimidazole ribonucleotide synthase n=1 Tax=Pendulispora albinea TaxID=2741071 RepID=A0ABZ2LP73_9BACT
MKRIGVLGGGQLGTMLAGAIHDLGAEACIYEPDAAAPACARFREVVNAPWTDAPALERFFSSCDAVTYEMEHIDTTALKSLRSPTPLWPNVHVLEVAQDRIREKTFLEHAHLPHVAFTAVTGRDELLRSAASFGYPFIIKTVRGGYDGKGQAFVASAEELGPIVESLAPDGTYLLEEAIDLALEASVIVGRSPRGEEVVFPVFENVHAEHILDLTIVPARIPPELAERLQAIALEAARALDVHGLLTTEFFLSRTQGPEVPTRPGRVASRSVAAFGYHVYVNEFAPRPHNSGHVTRNACTASQYDVLARILLGVPVNSPELVGPGVFCMGNLLGDIWLAQGRVDLDLSCLREFPEVIDVVLYGKRNAQARRKMGHFVTQAPDADRAIRSAKAFRQKLLT